MGRYAARTEVQRCAWPKNIRTTALLLCCATHLGKFLPRIPAAPKAAPMRRPANLFLPPRPSRTLLSLRVLPPRPSRTLLGLRVLPPRPSRTLLSLRVLPPRPRRTLLSPRGLPRTHTRSQPRRA